MSRNNWAQKSLARTVLGITLLGFFGLSSIATDADAHGIWFAERASKTAIIYGHGAEDSDMIRRLDKLGGITAQSASGEALAASWKITDHLVFATAESPVVLTATLDNGFWTKDETGKWIAKGHDEVPRGTRSGRYLKYTTYIARDLDKPLAPIAGHRLQILPVSPKLPKHRGEPMRVKVLVDGKPTAGVKFWADYVGDPDAKPIISGKDGIVKFKVFSGGLSVLAAEFDAPSEEPAKTSKTAFFSTLSFPIKHTE